VAELEVLKYLPSFP